MSVFRTVLAATDFSEDAGHAAARAALLARELPARLSLIHVVPAPMLQALRSLFGSGADAEARLLEDARQSIATLAGLLGDRGSPAIAHEVRVGRVVDELLEAATTSDLLVLGAHGSNPLRDLILGTTAERLISRLTRPALVVRQPSRTSYRQVLVATDFSPDADAALRGALQLAPRAALTVVHAFDIPFENKLRAAGVSDDEIAGYRVRARRTAMQEIERSVAQAGGDPASVARIVQQGAAGRVLLEHAEQLDADLVVIGKHGQSGVEELMLGSVTRHVLSDAKCDVLVVRRRPEEERPA
jgi:nucleotide-binding universal stress UspA family protein